MDIALANIKNLIKILNQKCPAYISSLGGTEANSENPIKINKEFMDLGVRE